MPFRDGERQRTRAAARGPTAAVTRLGELLRGDGDSVTELLEHLAGEPVDADVRARSRGAARPDDPLGLSPGSEVLRRAVVLRGRVSGRGFVYAETSIAPGRLPPPVVHRLEATRDPIGRVLRDNRIPIGREHLPGRARATRAERPIAVELARSVLSRRYRILVGIAPAFAVDEWFLEPVGEVMSTGAGTDPDRGR